MERASAYLPRESTEVRVNLDRGSICTLFDKRLRGYACWRIRVARQEMALPVLALGPRGEPFVG